MYPVYVDSNAMAGRAGDYDAAAERWTNITYMPTTAENGIEAYIAGIGKGGITFFGVDLSRGLYLPKTSYITPVR